jgi:hypothetical protein
MSLVRRVDPIHATARAAQAEIILWTTKDGREIPLDDMGDAHIANAIRVLTLWRSRLKKRDPGHDMLAQLAQAITRFKLIQRKRRRQAPKEPRLQKEPRAHSLASRSGFASKRPRKPVAST